MKGSCIIDGFDIDELGIFILKGGDNDFISFPDRKEPASNDWFEIDGLDVDLSEIYFKEKKVVVKFYLKGESTDEFLYNLDSFYSLLSQKGLRSVFVREFEKTFQLHFTSCSDYQQKRGLIRSGAKSVDLTVEFMMDDSLQIFDAAIMVPIAQREYLSYVTLNGIDLSLFGIIIQNAYNTALRLPALKEGLTRTFERKNGITVDVDFEPTKKTKDIVLECTMLSDSLLDFYTNYNALFNNLRILEALTLGFNGSSGIKCYYSKMQNFIKNKPFSRGISISFELVFVTIDDGSFFDYDQRLTEDGEIRLTEDNKERIV